MDRTDLSDVTHIGATLMKISFESEVVVNWVPRIDTVVTEEVVFGTD